MKEFTLTADHFANTSQSTQLRQHLIEELLIETDLPTILAVLNITESDVSFELSDESDSDNASELSDEKEPKLFYLLLQEHREDALILIRHVKTLIERVETESRATRIDLFRQVFNLLAATDYDEDYIADILNAKEDDELNTQYLPILQTIFTWLLIHDKTFYASFLENPANVMAVNNFVGLLLASIEKNLLLPEQIYQIFSQQNQQKETLLHRLLQWKNKNTFEQCIYVLKNLIHQKPECAVQIYSLLQIKDCHGNEINNLKPWLPSDFHTSLDPRHLEELKHTYLRASILCHQRQYQLNLDSYSRPEITVAQFKFFLLRLLNATVQFDQEQALLPYCLPNSKGQKLGEIIVCHPDGKLLLPLYLKLLENILDKYPALTLAVDDLLQQSGTNDSLSITSFLQKLPIDHPAQVNYQNILVKTYQWIVNHPDNFALVLQKHQHNPDMLNDLWHAVVTEFSDPTKDLDEKLYFISLALSPLMPTQLGRISLASLLTQLAEVPENLTAELALFITFATKHLLNIVDKTENFSGDHARQFWQILLDCNQACPFPTETRIVFRDLTQLYGTSIDKSLRLLTVLSYAPNFGLKFLQLPQVNQAYFSLLERICLLIAIKVDEPNQSTLAIKMDYLLNQLKRRLATLPITAEVSFSQRNIGYLLERIKPHVKPTNVAMSLLFARKPPIAPRVQSIAAPAERHTACQL